MCQNHRQKEPVKDGERNGSVLCWQADVRSCHLPRSSTSHPITPAFSHHLVACHSLSSTSLSLHLFIFCLMLSLSSLYARLLYWPHVKCQVQSQLTDLFWHVREYKSSKAMFPSLSRITPVSGSVLIHSCLLKGWEGHSCLEGAIRVKSPKQRYLATIYSH